MIEPGTRFEIAHVGIGSFWTGLDHHQEDQARVLGASRLRAFAELKASCSKYARRACASRRCLA